MSDIHPKMNNYLPSVAWIEAGRGKVTAHFGQMNVEKTLMHAVFRCKGTKFFANMQTRMRKWAFFLMKNRFFLKIS